MVHWLDVVQVLVLYITVLLGVLLYVTVLQRLNDVGQRSQTELKSVRHLTLWLLGVITMVFGVCYAHSIWSQHDDLWIPLLGILIVSAALILHRLRRLSPKAK